MKSLFRSIVLVMLLVVVTAACTKYPDGPKFSVRTKKSRACGDWVFEQVLSGKNDLTSDYRSLYPNYHLTLVNDGSCAIRFGGYTFKGDWKFDETKSYLIIPNIANSGTISMKILKLENEALWVIDGSNMEVHFANTQK